MNARDIATALVAKHYRRVWHRKRWRMAWWPRGNESPMEMGNRLADRRALLREGTGLSRACYSEQLWDEVVRLLPEVPSYAELEKIIVANRGMTEDEIRALFDRTELTGSAP